MIILLLLPREKIDKTLLSSRWIKECESKGVVIPIWTFSTQDLSQWIQNRSQHYKIKLENAAFKELLNRTQGNLNAAEHALQQLALFPQPVTLTQLQELIADEAEYAVTDFVQQLLQRQYARSLHILNRLQQHDVEPTWIIWQLANGLRKAQRPLAKILLPLLSQVEANLKGGDSLNSWLALKNFTYEAIKHG